MKIGCCPTFTKQSDFVTDVKKKQCYSLSSQKRPFYLF